MRKRSAPRVFIKDRPLYDQAILKEWLSYDPATGEFRWLKKPSHRINVGALAGARMVGGTDYIQIMKSKQAYLAHRLAWVYMTGQLPPNMIDHINGIRHDNRWCNLRPADHAINQQNQRKARSNSQTGVLGVTCSGRGYRAIVGANGRNHYSTTYTTIEEAAAAYIEMKRRLHPGCTI